MTRHHQRHSLGLLLPESGAALDIREKKGDGSLFRHSFYLPSIRQGRMLLRRYRAASQRTPQVSHLAYALARCECADWGRLK